jgi:polyadenylate-binding protein
MNGHALPSGEVLTVVEYLSSMGEKKQINQGSQHASFTNLYVKSFPRADFEEEDLKEIFSKYGDISSAVIMRDENQKSKGFGFVCFKNSADAKRALDAFQQL